MGEDRDCERPHLLNLITTLRSCSSHLMALFMEAYVTLIEDIEKKKSASEAKNKGRSITIQ